MPREVDGSSGRALVHRKSEPTKPNNMKITRNSSRTGLRDILPQPVQTGLQESRKSIRRRLSHISEVQKKELEQMVDRYRCMPDCYYDGINAVSPKELGDDQAMQEKGYIKGKPAAMSEWFAGTG